MSTSKLVQVATLIALSSPLYAQNAHRFQQSSRPAKHNYRSGFELPAQFKLGAPAHAITATDLNNDGIMDFAIHSNLSIMVILSTGTRTYAQPITYPAPGTFPGRDIVSGDFDNDGDNDLAYLTPVGTLGDGNFAVNILSNLGNGSFSNASSFTVIHPFDTTTFFQMNEWTATDLNNDGYTDFAIASTVGGLAPGDGYLTIVMNSTPQTGSLSFNESISHSTNQGTSFIIQAADLDNDGDQDIVMTHAPDNGISVYLNDGDGINGNMNPDNLSGSNDFGSRPLAIGDLNNDGYADLLYLKSGQFPNLNSIKVLLNLDAGTDPRDAGTFRESLEFPIGPTQLPVSFGTRMFINDFDNDGFNDIATSFAGTVGSIILIPELGPQRSISENFIHQDTVALDLEGDGDIDFVSVNGNGSMLSILRNRGQRPFSMRP
jgi:hypothetical protein